MKRAVKATRTDCYDRILENGKQYAKVKYREGEIERERERIGVWRGKGGEDRDGF